MKLEAPAAKALLCARSPLKAHTRHEFLLEIVTGETNLSSVGAQPGEDFLSAFEEAFGSVTYFCVPRRLADELGVEANGSIGLEAAVDPS